ncbi:alpha/beta hydrolase [Euzebya sp.]|uniref:alpha/beta hydrolase n=1 Tax=Euzebya sp. TaxID=1971409 RepID=UPI003515EEB8
MGNDRGQSTIEWLGVAAVVVAALAVLLATDLARPVTTAVTGLVCRVAGSGCEGEGTGGGGGDPAAARAGDDEGTAGLGPEDQRSGATDGDDVLDAEEHAAIAAVLDSGDPAAIHDALSGLSDAEAAAAVAALRDQIALTDGVPQPLRVAANSERITAHIAELEAALAALDAGDDGGILGAVEDFVEGHNPTPDFVFGEPAPDTPAEQAALLEQRIAMLEGWIADDRQIIAFEPPTTLLGGDARIVEVFGDLETADHVGVLVPGITTDLDSYEGGLATSARDFRGAAGESTAVVAHLGYDAPDSLTDGATLTGERARGAAPDLAGFVNSLDADGRDRDVTLVGHSYGSRVAAEATQLGTDVDNLVLIGSPGTGVETAGDLGVDPQDVYIGRNGDDPIRHVGTIEGGVDGVLGGIDDVLGTDLDTGDLGHGRDPVDDGYGGQLIDAPPTGGHGGYFDPLAGVGESVVAIIDGRPEDAHVAADRGAGTPR